ncbi:linear amide C-N hydrolase [Legionella pneumophila]|uniref:linear amide C-N hydrolase n=1 Tax=Legionella pneumophila TaxID=446 RepID=UPI001A339E28|nr:linear amide C-N hydrolase [Legionella pneumophila]HAT9399507.1 linear amide C-N hydrolase [Legionella pneumophila subsp. pneumophila]MCW8401770.1 linear amide C-N hydrolase [Legionella pneumophila]MCZ4697395.1 linear amide C-N hydrolase [Legionella pneumophila]MCZ4712631.1 linear amide C-N hydrolase [Legionella pneumophila]MCZ4745179.1 linear amide C-N hydrolase [Legionella pneumophila]
MFKRIGLISIALSLNTISLTSEACSALVFNKNKPATVAVNLDWKYREGAFVIHPRNAMMVSSVDYHSMHPLIWKSQYGSVIFHGGNRFKAGPSADGMNEKGLTASILMLDSSRYPSNSELPALKTTEWVQYILDNFQTVQEVIDDSSNYQLVADTYRGITMNVHLMVSDAEGKSAVFEYLDGKLVIHTQDNLTMPVLTNTDYKSSLALLEEYQDHGGSKALPGGYDSKSRFVRAAHYLKKLPSFIAKEEHIAYAFNGLNVVTQAPGTSSPTQLSMVFDIPTKTIYFRSINEAALRVISMDSIDFDYLYQPIALNVYQHLSGDVTDKFQPMIG